MPAARAKNTAPRNIFYVALVLVAVLFTLTACGYGLAMFLGVKNSNLLEADPAAARYSTHPLLQLMDAYGLKLMIWELVLLGCFTTLAIGLDARRERLDKQNPSSSPTS